MFSENNSRAIDIIGGADGPTSVYLKKQKVPIRHYIRNLIYKYKGKRAEKRIVSGTHTLAELVEYATVRYAAVELDINHKRYRMQKECMKESLVTRHRTDLLGELKEISMPKTMDAEAINHFNELWQKRIQYIQSIPDTELKMDYHIYEIHKGSGRVELEIDYIWNEFCISYSGNKKAMKQMKKIAQDLAIYYGVTEEDIQNRTERYLSLRASLSD